MACGYRETFYATVSYLSTAGGEHPTIGRNVQSVGINSLFLFGYRGNVNGVE